ncbi:MAG: GIY-YIG nuclease family protein [Verrucomicrobiae bacterium]|nr:GIY-YIG nuclease family protein [Verrucomicrobiae bacterium]
MQSKKTGRRYVGSCENLQRRFLQHNTGQSVSTRHGISWRLIYISRVFQHSS